MTATSKTLLFLAFLAASSVVHAESTIERKLDKLAVSLVPSGLKTDAKDRPVAAVLPFNCEPKLAQKNIGGAMSEMLSHSLVKNKTFRVVERSQFENILAEQHLQQTGAIDSNEAVSVGRMLGAKFVVVGSITRMGQNYQVNARLVEVESNEVRASGFEEFRAGTFEEEAKPLLTLVPEVQAIGIYAAYLWSPTSNAQPAASATRDNGFGFPLNNTITPKDIDFHLAGAGLRYAPMKRLYLDAAYFTSVGDDDVADVVQTDGVLTAQSTLELKSSWAARALVGTVLALNSRLALRAAAGIFQYHLEAEDSLPTGSFRSKLSRTAPHALVGVEFRPQQRIGLGLSAGYSFGDLEMKLESHPEIVIFEVEPLTLEGSVALYF